MPIDYPILRAAALCIALIPGLWGHAAEPSKLPLETLAKNAAEAALDGKTKEAVAMYIEWVERDPLNPLARASCGAALYQDGQWGPARRQLERAVLMEPKLAQSWGTLGLLYDKAGEDWLALSAYTRAVHLEPKIARYRILLALALEKRGWRDAAESALQEATTIDPESSDAQFNLAALALRRTPPAIETARRHYEQALKLGARPDEDVEAILAGERKPEPSTNKKPKPGNHGG